MRTERNKEHTKEESRTSVSDFKVIVFLYDESVRRMFWLLVFFLFKNKLEIDKEQTWVNQKQRN